MSSCMIPADRLQVPVIQSQSCELHPSHDKAIFVTVMNCYDESCGVVTHSSYLTTSNPERVWTDSQPITDQINCQLMLNMTKTLVKN